jgi:hypothetical protein
VKIQFQSAMPQWKTLIFVTSFVAMPSWPGFARADPLTALDKVFRETYASATTDKFSALRRDAPLLVNRFGQIALYRPGAETPEIFSIDMGTYLKARSIAHAPISLIVRLLSARPGRLDAPTSAWLAQFELLLSDAETQLAELKSSGSGLGSEQRDLIATTRRFVQRIRQRDEFDPSLFNEVDQALLPGIQASLDLAARSQLDQFRERMRKWKTAYPSLAWDNSVVVVLGNHQARNAFLQRQFFDWLLKDKPEKEMQVVYAETLDIPPSLDKEPPEEAIRLLAKVMLDKSISEIVFGDPIAMQSDVLGPAASKIITQWPDRLP